MELQRQDTTHGSFGFTIVGYINGLLAINELLKVIALGNDNVIIPSPLLDRGLDLLRIPDRADDLLLAVLVPNYFFSSSSHNAAKAFFVKNARISRPGFHIRLVAADHPIRRI